MGAARAVPEKQSSDHSGLATAGVWAFLMPEDESASRIVKARECGINEDQPGQTATGA
jgi:hypothetical protein